jgi:hypothetical protein
MAKPFGSRLKHAWNAFIGNNEPEDYLEYRDLGYQSSYSPFRPRFSRGNERSIITAIYNKIALDVAAYDITHVRLDENGRYKETMDSGLQNCFSVEANKDQTGRAFIHDAIISMFDEGVVALVPVDTAISPKDTSGYDILTMRTGKITAWYPDHVRVDLYNDRKGIREEIILPKSIVAIIENPHFAIMNEPNGTLQRLIRKLVLLDVIDEQSGSGKLDIIIQLPYIIKTEARRQQAEERRRAIEEQLSGSRYGIAYTDGTERITQLNRPSNNNLLEQITYLTRMLYSQLGISEDVFSGKANEKAMVNYYNRTVEPLVTALSEEMRRKFLTKTARTQGQSIMGFRDILRLIPANEMADMADAFTRNEILTPNEIRSILGIKPSKDPGADDIRNKNMPIDKQPNSYIKKRKPVEEEEEGEEKEQTRLLYDIE